AATTTLTSNSSCFAVRVADLAISREIATRPAWEKAISREIVHLTRGGRPDTTTSKTGTQTSGGAIHVRSAMPSSLIGPGRPVELVERFGGQR
ncbi:hypothetical protein, partial [Saccharopolyspora sp. 5N708]|uniref:hypothetical protein n=1 Tax=Saccharopolyspora sp. 5N708 TaxID=3457424 RepID=UPI003FD506CE